MPVSSGQAAQNAKDTKESKALLERKADPEVSDFTNQRPISAPFGPTSKESRHMDKAKTIVGADKMGRA